MIKEYIIGKKRYIKIFGYTLLTLGITGLGYTISTNSKYIKTVDEALIYNNTLLKLYVGDNFQSKKVDYSRSTKNNIAVSFTFPRNSIGLGKNDKYIIDIPQGCSVSSKNNSIVDEGTNKVINFSNLVTTNSTIDVLVSCPTNLVTSLPDLVIPLKIREKISNDEDAFRYLDGTFRISKNEYEGKFASSTSEYFEIITEDISSLRKLFASWVRTYYIDTEYESISGNVYNAVYDYLSPLEGITVTNGKLSKDITKINLLGLNIKQDELNSNKYRLTITKDFIGYARTAYHASVYADNPHTMYFSGTSNLKSIFDYYVVTYFYKEKNDLETINDYLNFYKIDIDKLILNNEGKIPGITRVSNKQLDINKLLTYATNYKNTPIMIEVGNGGPMYDDFINELAVSYKDVVSTNALEKGIPQTNEIIMSVIKNSSDVVSDENPRINFNDYFIYYDEEEGYKNYLLINISSSVDKKYNYAHIDVLKSSKDSSIDKLQINNITMSNIIEENNDILEITIEDDSKENITSMLKILEGLLKIEGNIENEDSTYGINKSKIESTEQGFKLTFKIKKLVEKE